VQEVKLQAAGVQFGTKSTTQLRSTVDVKRLVLQVCNLAKQQEFSFSPGSFSNSKLRCVAAI